MPVGYGSRIDLPELSRAQIGVSIPADQTSSLIGILRIVVTIAEVGLSLLTANPFVGTAIALGAAGANTALDVASTGTVSPTNIGINFGSALIPGVSQGVKAINQIRRGGRIIAGLGEQASQVSTSLDRFATAAQKEEQFFGSALATNSRPLSELSRRQVGQLADVIKSEGGVAGGAGGLSFRATEQTKGALGDLIKSQFGVSNRALTAGTEAAESTEEDIRKIEMASGITREEGEVLSSLLARTSTMEERSVVTVEYLRSIGKLDALRKLAPLATDAELAAILRQGNSAILENPGYIAQIKLRARK